MNYNNKKFINYSKFKNKNTKKLIISNSFGINKKNTNKLITNLKNEKIMEKVKKIMSYNDNELNDLSYTLALKYDKRSYFIYYVSLLKTKHDFVSTFFNNTDYNSKIIKMDLLFFSYILSLTINTLFFTDKTMHQIYEDEGIYNFVFQLPQIFFLL